VDGDPVEQKKKAKPALNLLIEKTQWNYV